MAYKVTFRFRGRCEKHPRYDPAKNGEGTIKGGCETCVQLYKLYCFVRHAEETVKLIPQEVKQHEK